MQSQRKNCTTAQTTSAQTQFEEGRSSKDRDDASSVSIVEIEERGSEDGLSATGCSNSQLECGSATRERKEAQGRDMHERRTDGVARLLEIGCWAALIRRSLAIIGIRSRTIRRLTQPLFYE